MTKRNKITLLAGVLSAIFAGLLLLLAAFLAITGASVREPIVFSVISVFPLLIAIACISTKYRTTALRFVGGITAIAVAGVLINSFVNPEVKIGLRGYGIYLAMCVGAAYIAVKGRWPSS